jgi:hypothetical protein
MSRTITLFSYDINPSINVNDYATAAVVTSNGTIGRQFQYMIWNNINLETMVGSTFFNAYSKFTIRMLQCIVCDLSGNSTYGFDISGVSRLDNANSEFVLSGLDFNPMPYSHINPTNTGASIFTCTLAQIPSSATAVVNFTGTINLRTNKAVTYRFNKPTGSLTLKIDRFIPNTNTYAPTTAFGYGHFKFLFEICGSQ